MSLSDRERYYGQNFRLENIRQRHIIFINIFCVERKYNTILMLNLYLKKINSVALVRKRTIPAERPPLVGEVSANFCG
jgi:hypothetical protein